MEEDEREEDCLRKDRGSNKYYTFNSQLFLPRMRFNMSPFKKHPLLPLSSETCCCEVMFFKKDRRFIQQKHSHMRLKLLLLHRLTF